MAKTQAQWFTTLKSWVPEWFFGQENSNVAIFQSIAKILSESEVDLDEQMMKTFILQSSETYLDLHGYERTVVRLTSELDPPYAIRIRVKSLISQLSKPDLLAIVNALLIRGYATIREDFEGSIFCDREEFATRGAIVIEPIENTFTVLVDKQIRDPYSFVDREYFGDRSDFIGNSESSDFVFELILNAVNDNKAFGTLFRIIERLS